MFLRFTVCVFCERLSIFVRGCASFSFDFVGGMWDLIALIPVYCLSIYFVLLITNIKRMVFIGFDNCRNYMYFIISNISKPLTST